MKRLFVSAAGALLFLTVLNGQQDEGRKPFERFLSQQKKPLEQFSATCRLEGKARWFGASAKMEVETDFQNGVFTYKVVSEEGHDYIRNKVLRRALEEEKNQKEDNSDGVAFTAENYIFGQAWETKDGLWKLTASPRRPGKLKDCFLFIDASGALVRSVVRPAESPEHVSGAVIETAYARVSGVRVPIHIKATSRVAFLIPASLEIWYVYKSVNGTEVADTK